MKVLCLVFAFGALCRRVFEFLFKAFAFNFHLNVVSQLLCMKYEIMLFVTSVKSYNALMVSCQLNS